MDNYEKDTEEKVTNTLPDNSENLEDRKSYKKIISRCGIYLSLVIIAITIVQYVLTLIIQRYFYEFYVSDWFSLTITAISILGVALPLLYGLMKTLPDTERGEVKKLSTGQIIRFFLASYTIMYICNYVSIIILFVIYGIKGYEIINPLEEAIFGSNMFMVIIYACIVGPIAEELLFRKILLDRLRRFGDLPAILITGIAFGLFHMNLFQVFYAAAVGIILAYITVRTNTIKYSIILHIMINTIGSGLGYIIISQGNYAAIIIFYICRLAIIIAGTIILAKDYRNIRLEKPAVPFLKIRDYIFNPGVLIYTAICLVSIILQLL